MYNFFTVLSWLIPVIGGLLFLWVTMVEGTLSDATWFGLMALLTVGFPILFILWIIVLFIHWLIGMAYKKEKLRSAEKKSEE